MASIYVGFQGYTPVLLASSRRKAARHPVVVCDRVEKMGAQDAERLADGRIHLGADIEAARRRCSAEARIAALQAYLKETDWYAVRLADSGEPMPEEVRAARKAARCEIDSLRGA